MGQSFAFGIAFGLASDLIGVLARTTEVVELVERGIAIVVVGRYSFVVVGHYRKGN